MFVSLLFTSLHSPFPQNALERGGSDTNCPHLRAEQLLWEGGQNSESLLGLSGAHATTPIIGNDSKATDAECSRSHTAAQGWAPTAPARGFWLSQLHI